MRIKLVEIGGKSDAELEKLALQGKNFRINEIFICMICESQTNLATVGEYGISVRCPNFSERWHSMLSPKVYRLNESGHPKSYEKELRNEIDKIKKASPSIVDVKGKVTTSPKKMTSWDKTSIYSYPDCW